MIKLNNVLFDFDKSVLKPEGKKEVDKLVAEMKKYKNDTVIIQGHTCTVGAEAYNMALGQRRADSIVRYLVSLGLSEDMFQTVSYGKERPIAQGANEDAWQMNRRGEFVIEDVGAL